ncbi:hypothetical protein GW17_00038936, partial [Ensete ventricosum]
EAVISPAAKEGLVPLVIPLSESSADLAVFCSSVLIMLTLFLSYRMEMPVVEVHKHGVWLLAKSVRDSKLRDNTGLAS